jgi:hypothetical protein
MSSTDEFDIEIHDSFFDASSIFPAITKEYIVPSSLLPFASASSPSSLSPPVPVSYAKPLQVLYEHPMVYSFTHDNHLLYCIKRQSEIFFLQKHLELTFFNNQSTFNSICWTHKIEKVSATSMELKLIRDNDLHEQGLKKSNVISMEAITKLCIVIKRIDMLTILQDLLNHMV